ncbi:MAG: bifunctional diaminohydroxyphosphoribosylaminopyrimidine deaminase/5-amino-6-(5-phosphoribosylamino)uracil reductase RibD [Candidatus Schekmanbacteria bacterium]|nr:bifunctional diaminohydroxyphosphoribosylaminopyrimidine deaminase/5-amino-6-(5-phosphoribosylamino)uracil reductase RibD [Candidatus Schekmanbacteria bacterium]
MSDEHFMSRALDLAARADGWVSPNPMVGALLVSGNEIIGEGYHRRLGAAHAEAEAIAATRADHGTGALQASTLYSTLEPCTHFGRTPPCVDDIISAKIPRVVVGAIDPNPKVNGKGVAALRTAGVEVVVGCLADRVRSLNEVYWTYMTKERPFVLLKGAVSLDGKLASRSGDSRWVSSEAARHRGHEMRSRVDAVSIGLGTVRADDPLLTVRYVPIRRRQPTRVVFDTTLGIPPDSRLVATATEVKTIVACGPGAPQDREEVLRARAVEVWRCDLDARGRVSPADVLRRLRTLEIASVLLEGGGTLNASFLEGGFVDRIELFLCPVVLGGIRAVPLVAGNGWESVAAAPRYRFGAVEAIGSDYLVTAYPLASAGE